MCGRYTFATDINEYGSVFGFTLSDSYKYFDFDDGDDITVSAANLSRPRYNVAPTQYAPVIISNDEGKNKELAIMRWGLVPSWAKSADFGRNMINARAETLAEKPSFVDAFDDRRCLVPADGFYEWKADAVGSKKRPVRFVVKTGELFAFAGLWEKWKQPDGNGTLLTYTIITTTANELVSQCHNRMPVILTPDTAKVWFRDRRVGDANYESILQPFPAEKMDAYRVSSRVNSPANEGVELVKPIMW